VAEKHAIQDLILYVPVLVDSPCLEQLICF
jgi:hypothetical protein